jgi:hypothetical protein
MIKATAKGVNAESPLLFVESFEKSRIYPSVGKEMCISSAKRQVIVLKSTLMYEVINPLGLSDSQQNGEHFGTKMRNAPVVWRSEGCRDGRRDQLFHSGSSLLVTVTEVGFQCAFREVATPVRLGVCIERSPEMAVSSNILQKLLYGLISVWRSGGSKERRVGRR